MPFPTTAVLDTFTGADESPITTNWTCPLFSGELGYNRLSNAIAPSALGQFSNGYYDIATFGTDSEAWVTITTMGAATDHLTLYAAMINAGAAALDGYAVRMICAAGAETVRLLRYDDGSSTTLGADITSESFVDGDGLGVQRVGSDVTAWRRSGGVWSLIGTRTDATYTHTGHIGLQFFAATPPSTFVLDDFGGGGGGVTHIGKRGMSMVS